MLAYQDVSSPIHAHNAVHLIIARTAVSFCHHHSGAVSFCHPSLCKIALHQRNAIIAAKAHFHD